MFFELGLLLFLLGLFLTVRQNTTSKRKDAHSTTEKIEHGSQVHSCTQCPSTIEPRNGLQENHEQLQ